MNYANYPLIKLHNEKHRVNSMIIKLFKKSYIRYIFLYFHKGKSTLSMLKQLEEFLSSCKDIIIGNLIIYQSISDGSSNFGFVNVCSYCCYNYGKTH